MAESVKSERHTGRSFESSPLGLMKMQEWNQRRKFFNHQVWKNEFVLALECLAAKNREDGIGGEIRSVEDAWTVWKDLRADVEALFESYEGDCSPRNFLDVAPLAPIDPKTAEWLPDLIHNDWLIRRGVRQWVKMGGAMITGIDEAIAACTSQRKGDSGKRLSELIGKCKALGDHLQDFPTRLCCI